MRTHRDRASSRPRFFFFRTVILADHCARKGPNQADWTLFTGENWTLSDRRQHWQVIVAGRIGNGVSFGRLEDMPVLGLAPMEVSHKYNFHLGWRIAEPMRQQ